MKVAQQFLKCIALRSATWNRRDFRPITAFFRFVNYNFNSHDSNSRLGNAPQMLRRPLTIRNASSGVAMSPAPSVWSEFLLLGFKKFESLVTKI
jgi:hypothetical protein